VKKLLAFSSIFLFAVLICSCRQPEERTYTDADAQKIKDNAAKLWNGGDVAIVDSLYSADCIYHNADLADLKGAEEIKGFVKWVYSVYPDFAVTLDEPMQFKDRLVITYKVTGTNNGPLNENMLPTGKKISFTGIDICKIADGRITEEWNSYNQLPMYRQLGFKLVPEEVKEKKK
jgi:predicted ester cyclase